ncbi:MAG: transcriptional repressor LexA [Candidatus Eisenbacteria bacterium]|uniref:LexA repressor n=1 Tax=Eiseniibacteriota bacterium TaxID=2212470 RepID=A0A538TNI2_UNCEI|nr:MAG: transcriptional repressor LexA [Candidatus Eisenbacteria bacterium]
MRIRRSSETNEIGEGIVLLTPRQRVTYDFITAFRGGKGFAPSYEEIRRHLGVSSLNAVAKLVTQLRRRGYLAPAPHNAKRWLAPPARRAGGGTIPLLGVVAAGRPIEPVEVPEEIAVPAAMTGAGERYALRVSGDSMIEDGIHDGDIVVVRRARRAENGQTVVAVVDGEATLKRFRLTGDRVELHPANAALEVMRVSADRVEIRGVLVGLLRSYA